MIPLLAAALGLATATSAPSAGELATRNRAASGSERRPAARERWLVRSAGLTGTLDVLRDGNDVASTLLLGPFRTERGVFHGERWHQNDNGETVLERPEPSQAERTVSESVLRVREPVDAWAVTTTYASGHVLRSFYDARSYLVVRTEKSASGHTVSTNYDAFRTDARGRTRATHYYGTDDRFGTDFDYRLASDEPDPGLAPAASDLAIPPDRRPLVEFPAGIDSVALPARIEGDRVYVRLRIAGRALDFLLDSGCSTLALDAGVARSLGLAGLGHSTETVAGTFAEQRVIVPAVELGPLEMHDVVMRTAPLAENEGTRTRVVGLLGFDFLAAVGLKVDYAAGTVEALRPAVLAAPAGSVPLQLRLNGQVPVTTATVGDATGDDFIVDTGAEFDLVLFQRFLKAHPQPARALAPARVRYGNAVGGAVAYRPLEVPALTLGPLAFAKPDAVAALPVTALGFDTLDGLVGAGVLGRFTLYFDYAASRLYLAHAARRPADTNGRAASSVRAVRGASHVRPGNP